MECVARMETGQSEATLDFQRSRKWVLRVLDYPGEVFRRAFVEDAQDEAARAHASCGGACIGRSIVSGARWVDAEFGVSNALRRVQAASGDVEVPVAIVLTKCDVAIGHIREVGSPRAFVDHYLTVGHSGCLPHQQFGHAPMRLCIGYRRATSVVV